MKQRPLWPLLPPLAIFGMMLLAIGLAGGFERDAQHTSLICGVRQLTGFYCPGCGGTRCAMHVLSGQWTIAFAYNPLLMSGFVFFMAFSCYLIIRITILGKAPPRLPHISGPWIIAGLACIALFTILRNIPVYPFILLAP